MLIRVLISIIVNMFREDTGHVSRQPYRGEKIVSAHWIEWPGWKN